MEVNFLSVAVFFAQILKVVETPLTAALQDSAAMQREHEVNIAEEGFL